MWNWISKVFGFKQQDRQLINQFIELLKEEDRSDANDRLSKPTRQDQNLIDAIREQTEKANRNNLTRTEAYLTFFQQHPEIHWAFLAHMVSRNGGWSMTDVKGSLLRPVLSEQMVQSLFDMFERSNWLIFHDAYPQLLVYAASVRHGKPLFHLLPHFGISRFMTKVWPSFWQEKKSSLLTIALIVNEQQYIEKRIVQHPHYRRTVLQTARFKLQTAFDFNQVVFPVAAESDRPRLVGRTMHNFRNVTHRIKTGRMLYLMLFHPSNCSRVYDWAVTHPHTGSRADYWPKRFDEKDSSSSDKVYSPVLHDAWPDVEHRTAEKGDWYVDPSSLSVIPEVTAYSERNFYVTDVYERSFRRLKILSYVAGAKHLFSRQG